MDCLLLFCLIFFGSRYRTSFLRVNYVFMFLFHCQICVRWKTRGSQGALSVSDCTSKLLWGWRGWRHCDHFTGNPKFSVQRHSSQVRTSVAAWVFTEEGLSDLTQGSGLDVWRGLRIYFRERRSSRIYLSVFLFLMFVSVLPTCIPVHCGGQKRPLGSLELELMDSCGLPCLCWNLNWGHLVLEKEGCCSFPAA